MKFFFKKIKMTLSSILSIFSMDDEKNIQLLPSKGRPYRIWRRRSKFYPFRGDDFFVTYPSGQTYRLLYRCQYYHFGHPCFVIAPTKLQRATRPSPIRKTPNYYRFWAAVLFFGRIIKFILIIFFFIIFLFYDGISIFLGDPERWIRNDLLPFYPEIWYVYLFLPIIIPSFIIFYLIRPSLLRQDEAEGREFYNDILETETLKEELYGERDKDSYSSRIRRNFDNIARAKEAKEKKRKEMFAKLPYSDYLMYRLKTIKICD
jgi:hypothetical protein